MKPGKRHKILGTYGTGAGTFVRNALRDSVAYQSLSHAERCVLLDMLRVYGVASLGDTVSLAGVGFHYTFSDCREPINESTFTTARRRICEHGFFRDEIALKSIAAGACSIFVPSRDWVKFVPTGTVARRLESRRKRKAATLRRGRERKTAFIQGKGATHDGVS